MNKPCSDLSQRYYKEVDNLMFIVERIIEANKQDKDIKIYLRELPIYYQAVKNAKEEKEKFERQITEVQERWKSNHS